MARIDKLLVERGLCRSRTQAQRLIEGGRVSILLPGGWTLIERPSQKVPENAEFKAEPDAEDRYVSRGGLKLEAILAASGIDVHGCVALDIGQSTGGFTDCLLQAGACKVVGVEVGHDQLADSLRGDPRVRVLEGINARDLPREPLLTEAPKGFDLAVMDVSFISQTLILPGLTPLLRPGGALLSLVKPQFEVGPEGIGKGGLVKDASWYPKVEERIRQCCAEAGLAIRTWCDSPIKGGDGNHEFLIYAVRAG